MKLLRLFVLLSAFSALSAFAQNPCYPTGCRTQTQGGWGNNCNGNNPGCFRDANFATAFPTGLTVGGNFTIHFASSNAVRLFLPAGSTPGVLTQNYTDPASTSAGVFAGQVTALAVSLGFSEAGLQGFCDLGSLYYSSVEQSNASLFAGMTVYQLFALGNQVLGGNLSGLPNGTTVSNLNDVITAINENFVDGTTDNGHLVCDVPLAVELISFVGVTDNGSISLTWTTASERDVQRFEIERSVSSQWNIAGSVNGMGDSPTGHTYTFADENIFAGTIYSYRLAEVSWDGSRRVLANVITVEAGVESALPADFALMQNYPNPFNPSTQISFTLPEASGVTLEVFDALGRSVATFANSAFAAGTHSVTFDAANMANGLYFYQLRAGDYSAVRKMMLIK